jgi:hypothetical protein
MTGAHARRTPARLAASTGCTFAATLGATLVIASSAAAAAPGTTSHAPGSHASGSHSPGTTRHPARSRAAGPAPSGAPTPRISGQPASGHSASPAPSQKRSSRAGKQSAPPGHAAVPPKLRTLFRTVRVFTSATKHAGIKGKISRRGTDLAVTCWTTGMFYGNGLIWYEISAPMPGYVSAFDVTAHDAPAAGVHHCHAPAFTAQFNSLVPDLAIHARPSQKVAISGYVVTMGTGVIVKCYARGTPNSGDPIWYHVISPASGYVSGQDLNTGGDPASGVPAC